MEVVATQGEKGSPILQFAYSANVFSLSLSLYLLIAIFITYFQ